MREIIRNWKPPQSRYTISNSNKFIINGIIAYEPRKYSIAHFRNLFYMGLLEQYAILEIKTGYTDHIDDNEYISILHGNNKPKNFKILKTRDKYGDNNFQWQL